MTEEEARSWLQDRHGTEKLQLLERYIGALLEANASQNLISKASEDTIWVRHILDSAQLVDFASMAQTWLDVGSGAGLPGIVLAILTGRPTLLVEPRRKRAEFLAAMVEQLGLRHTSVRQAEVEKVGGQVFAAIAARAFAPLGEVFSSTIQLTNPSTVWVLPKGRSAVRELEDVRAAWQGVFHVEQSLTDDDARIIVATDVRPR